MYFRGINQTTVLLTPTPTAVLPQGGRVMCPYQGTHQVDTNIYYGLVALASLGQALGEGNNHVTNNSKLLPVHAICTPTLHHIIYFDSLGLWRMHTLLTTLYSIFHCL